MKNETLHKATNDKLKKDLETLTVLFNNKLIGLLDLDAAPYTRISTSQIEISLAETDPKKKRLDVFGSEITFYNQSELGSTKKRVEINFGSTGSFNPTREEDKGATWRTTTAGKIMTTWNQTDALITLFTAQFERIVEMARFERELNQTK